MAFAYRLPFAAMQQGTVVRRRFRPPICGDIDTTLRYGVSALIRPPQGMIAASPMGTPYTLHRYSFEDYLAVEEVSTVKHEFLGGEIYAMAGGSVLHAALSAAMVALLHAQLTGQCRVYSSDLRVRVRATGLATYADAAVVCGRVETEPENAETVTNPSLLVEVLSPSTIEYDLGEKCEHYKQMPSVRALLYVWQDRRQVELRERTAQGWRAEIAGPGGTCAIESLGVRSDVDALYTAAGS